MLLKSSLTHNLVINSVIIFLLILNEYTNTLLLVGLNKDRTWVNFSGSSLDWAKQKGNFEEVQMAIETEKGKQTILYR